MNKNSRILIACEESGAVTDALIDLGFTNVWSCDLEPCSGKNPEWHLQQDVTELLKEKWDMIIAFPPCTYMSNAGACRMYPTKGNIDNDRFEKAMKAKEFFMAFYNADCEKIAIENPVPMKIIGLPQKTQAIQPYEYGHEFTKKTYLWLKGLPILNPTNIVEPKGPYVCGNSKIWKKQAAAGIVYGKEKNAKHRSKTFPGIAKAMATQWTIEQLSIL